VSLLEVIDLNVALTVAEGTIHPVDGVSLSIDRSMTLGIVGESGCGKSMTALAIMGLLPAPSGRLTSGSVNFNGVELTQLAQRELANIRGRDIAMVFQDPMTSLHPMMTIGSQIAEVVRRHRGLGRGEARRAAVGLLEEVGIPDAGRRVDSYPHQFSGGMRQRAMIAMAIACNPMLIIADEPTTALDVTVQAEVLALLKRLQRDHGTALILITHDMGVIAQMADEVIVMYAGQVVERAPTRALFDSPQHPYTEALLGALPRLDREDARQAPLMAIPGRPPVVLGRMTGCRFRERCQYAYLADDCDSVSPDLREIRPAHWIRTAHPADARQQPKATSA
jgi:oligopeptide/dipeptide ABC transporter ATP-binding protein